MTNLYLQFFGGRGSAGSRGGGGSTAAGSVKSEVDDFLKTIEDRPYGTGNKPIPEKQQKEYRSAKYFIDRVQENNDGNVILAGGFADGSDEYVHTTAKLNAYQRMVRKDARNIKTDLDLGVISAAEATKELKVLKSLDATIQDRRRLLKR